MRTIPVMAIILIAILWFSSDIVPVFAALLMALPVVTGALERSIREIDKKLLEMAWIFRFSRSDRFWKVIVPQILPAILTSAHLTLGLCWKVVIAGEILAIPARGIGSEMQLAQLSIESETVFAWTLVVVLSAALSQLFLSLGDRLRRWKPL
jgi:NitT/TauT family transport system permease protein